MLEEMYNSRNGNYGIKYRKMDETGNRYNQQHTTNNYHSNPPYSTPTNGTTK